MGKYPLKKTYRALFNQISGGFYMIRLSMIVRNERDRYLRRVLESASQYIDDAVIIDDASTDNTAELCEELLVNIPHRIIINSESKFSNEWELRHQQWEESTKESPDWILFLDADEVFEDSFKHGVSNLTESKSCTLYSFRLYDFWDENHYREDGFWRAHTVYRPFLLKYIKGFPYEFNRRSQHCGRLPINAYDLPNELSEYRIKHYGWASQEYRTSKFNRYMELDPNGANGSLSQYLSINDPHPNLIKWVET
jgi:glycosyltransferase involved in cell wall biosynthesis